MRKNCAPTESEQLQNDEQAARWSCDYEATMIKLDEAAKRFERVQTLFTELIDLFREAEAVDQQVSVINGSAPSGEFRRLHCNRAPAPLRFTPDRDIEPLLAQEGKKIVGHCTSALARWRAPRRCYTDVGSV